MASKRILITNDTEYLPRSLIPINKIVSYAALNNDTVYNGNNTSHLLMIFCKFYMRVFFKLTQKAEESKLPYMKLVRRFKWCLKPAPVFLAVLTVQNRPQIQQAFHAHTDFQ